MVMFQPQQKITRPMGNAQARNTPLGAAPAFGNTTNVNGAQTASQSPFNLGFMPKSQMISPGGMQAAGAVPPVVAQSMVGIGGPTAPAAPAQSASPAIQPQYPGGDVAGLATYYRNTAQKNYNPQAIEAQTREANRNAQYMGAEPVAGSSLASAQINSRRPADILNPVTARVGNTYDGMVGFANDPTRYNPTDSGMQARQQDNAQRAASGQLMSRERGNRFSGIQPVQSQTDFTQGDYARAQQVMMQKRGEREAARAADPAANENRLASIHRATVARANKHQEFMDANGGLNYRQADRLEKKRQSIERRAQRGDISRDEANKQLANAARVAVRRGTGMVGVEQPRANNSDRVRLPDGQLPEATRAKASETVQNLTNPEFKGGSPKFQQEAEIVRSVGLKPDQSAAGAAETIARTPFPLGDNEAALRTASAYRRYWGSMKDSNSKWDSDTGIMGFDTTDPQLTKMMNELAETPEDQLQSWIDKYSGHLATFGQKKKGSPVDPGAMFGM